MKKIISFDLDGTLVDGTYGDMVWNHGVPEEYSREYGIPFDRARELVRNEYLSVGDGRLEWYNIQYWLERFNLTVPADELLARYESYIVLLPFAREVLETLGEKYVLIIASNAARIFVEKEVSHADIGHHFTSVISATSDYRIVKKGDSFYKTLCEELHVSPEDIVHVGDHKIFDFEAPTRFGIESYHVHSEGNGHERVIPNLKVLLDKL
jgi:HAD superfamily hydrolase (TIGR01493 family)